jgi:rubrerythrin
MKKSIKGTRSEKNLMTAFAIESLAVNRYTYFAEAARQEGYAQIAGIFLETAENEKAHARLFFKFFEGGSVEITATFPAVPAIDTKSNLEASIEGENKSWKVRYADFARAAAEEGFSDIAALFESVATAERLHEERFSRLLGNMERGEVFAKGRIVRWLCTNCGYVAEGYAAPEDCPACKRSRAFFEMLAENY